MKAEIYWIPVMPQGRLAVMPRPRGGDWLADEVRAWQAEGVDIVLSLLTPGEVIELNLENEENSCRVAGIEYRSFPIADRGVPVSGSALLRSASELATELAGGKAIAVHCRQGIGRAPLFAIAILVLAGLDLESATAAVRQARGCPVPETAEQARWLAEFANRIPASTPK